MYDWEKSEGGGGKFNPLNQGPVPDDPSLTTTGQQFGGGAADFASWQAGITGAVDYLNMPDFQSIKAALQQSNYDEARSALIASPWAASHYNGGANFSSATPPGAAPLSGEGTSTSPGSGASITDPSSWAPAIISSIIGQKAISDILERGALIVFGGLLIVFGIWRMTSSKQHAAVKNQFKPVNNKRSPDESSGEPSEDTGSEQRQSTVSDRYVDESEEAYDAAKIGVA